MQVELSIKNKKANLSQLVVNRTVVFGRGRNVGIRLTHDQVSRAHCRLIVDDDQVMIEDLGSSNGTFVNGHRLEKGQQEPVSEGDTIAMGPIHFEVATIEQTATQAPSTPEIFESMTTAEESHAADPDSDTVTKSHENVVAEAVEENAAVIEQQDATSDEDQAIEEAFESFSNEPDDDFAAAFDEVMNNNERDEQPLVLTEEQSNIESSEELVSIEEETEPEADEADEVSNISPDDIMDILGDDTDEEEIPAGVSSDADLQVQSDDDDLQNFLKNL